MKTIVSMAVLLCLFISQINGEIRYTLPEVSTLDRSSDTETFGQAGEPQLPATYVKLLLPPSADLQTVTVTIENQVTENLSGKHTIEPVPLPVTSTGIVGTVRGKTIVDGKDISIYERNAFFPASPVRTVMTGQLRDYKIVDAVIQRGRYNPVTQEVSLLRSGTVSVSYKQARNYPTTAAQVSHNTIDMVRSLVNNPEVLEQYSMITPTNKVGYAIITTAAFASQSDMLNSFAKIKANDGYNVQIVTENDWGGGSGATAVNNIRAWLKDKYRKQAVEYAFVIGNPVKSSKVPMVDGPTISNKTPLTDVCYGDLTGSLSRGENRYYEYSTEGIANNKFDQYMEVHVGRLPTYNGVGEADMLLKRMIDYMIETKAQAESYRFNAVMPLNTFNDAQNGICFGEEVKKRLLDPKGFKNRRIYYNHAGTSADFPCSYNKTVEVWNSDKFGLMVLQGHGMVTYAEKALSTATTSQLKGDAFVHGFNISCNNGRPEDPTNLGYAILKKAGISEIASAVQIWYSTTTTQNFGKKGNGNDFAFSYFDNMINSKQGAAACFTKTRASLQIVSGNDWQNLCELNLYGCPAIGLYTYDVPQVTNIADFTSHITAPFSTTVREITQGKSFTLKNHTTSGMINIYNMQGKLVQSLPFSQKDATVLWNHAGVGKGIYFAKVALDAGNKSVQKLKLTVR